MASFSISNTPISPREEKDLPSLKTRSSLRNDKSFGENINYIIDPVNPPMHALANSSELLTLKHHLKSAFSSEHSSVMIGNIGRTKGELKFEIEIAHQAVQVPDRSC